MAENGSLLGGLCLGFQSWQIEGVGAFDGHAKSARPNLGRHDSKGTRHAKHHSVVVVLGQPVVHEQRARAAVDIGPGVLDFASCCQSFWNLFVVGFDQIDKVVVLDVLLCEFELANEAWVSLSEDGVSVARNDLPTRHGVRHKVVDVLPSPPVTVFGLKSEQVVQTLLVGQPVQGTCQTVHTCREGKVGI